MLGDWWRRRQERRAKQAAERQRLRAEYVEKLESEDPVALEVSRDFGDNDSLPWRAEVLAALPIVGLLLLSGIVAGLIVLFEAIQKATGG